MVLFYSQGPLCQNLPEERMNEYAFQGSPPPRLPGPVHALFGSSGSCWKGRGLDRGISSCLRVQSRREGEKVGGEAKVKGAGAPVRRRRQGRKSPGNNSSAQEAAAWPGAVCGAGPAGRGPSRLLLLLSKAQPGWGHGQMRWEKARCGNRPSRRP